MTPMFLCVRVLSYMILYYIQQVQLPLSIFYSHRGSIVRTGADMYEYWFGDTQYHKQTV